MRIRRPLAALLTSLALFGGGTATLSACGSPTTPEEGTTDEVGGEDDGDSDDTDSENDADSGDLPNNSDPEPEQEDAEDQQDPD
jgi:hypothetical protein